MDDPFQYTRVGVGVTVWKDGKILLGLRAGSHGAGEWASPGGHLERGESVADCVAREMAEECGISFANLRYQMTANIAHFMPKKHYLHMQVEVDWVAGEPQLLEPEKCREWRWCDPNDPPQPLFHPVRLALCSRQTGRIFFDRDEAEAIR